MLVLRALGNAYDGFWAGVGAFSAAIFYEVGVKAATTPGWFSVTRRVSLAVVAVVGVIATVVAAQSTGWRLAVGTALVLLFFVARSASRFLFYEDVRDFEQKSSRTAWLIAVPFLLLYAVSRFYRPEIERWLERNGLDDWVWLIAVTACVLAMPALPGDEPPPAHDGAASGR